MILEDLIRDSVAQKTRGHVPEPDVAGIRRRARRRSIGRAGAATVAASVIVIGGAYALGPALFRGDTQTAISPRGGLHTYMVGKSKVSIDGHVYRRAHGGGLGMTVSTKYGFVYLGSDNRLYLMSPDGSEHALGGPTKPAGAKDWYTSLAKDSSRPLVAWTSLESGKTVTHVYNLERGAEVASRVNPCAEGIDNTKSCGLVIGMDNGVVLGQLSPTMEDDPDPTVAGGRYLDPADGKTKRYSGQRPPVKSWPTHFVVWNSADPDATWFEARTTGSLEVVAVANKTVMTSGKGEVDLSGLGEAGKGWRTQQITSADTQQYVADDGMSRLYTGRLKDANGHHGYDVGIGPDDPTYVLGVGTDQRTKLILPPSRTATGGAGGHASSLFAYDTDGSPMALVKLKGESGWALFDCPVADPFAKSARCFLQQEGIAKAAFPGEDNS